MRNSLFGISSTLLSLCFGVSTLLAQSGDPLAFELINNAGDAIVFIDNNPQSEGQEMHLAFLNNYTESLFFAPLTGSASSSNYHLKLQVKHNYCQYFSKASLANIKLSSTSATNFQMTIDTSDNRYAYFYIINTNQLEMLPNVRQYIGLTGFKASSKSGPMASTAIRLVYQNAYDYKQKPLQPISNHFDNEIRIKNANGLENIPLHAGILGTQSVLNDGKTPNILTIGLENIAIANPTKPGAENIYYDTSTTLVISYKQEPNSSPPWAYPWALTTQAAFSNSVVANPPIIQLNRLPTTYWRAEISKDSTAWVIKADSIQSFSPKDVLSIELSGIISALPDGVSHIYVHYHNIKGYYDGFFSIPVTKSSILEKEDRVGIGLLPTQAQTLQVNGGIIARMGPPGNNGDRNNGYAFNKNKSTGLFCVRPNELSFYIDSWERMWVGDSLYMQGNIHAQKSLVSGTTVSAGQNFSAGTIEANTTIDAGDAITAGGAIFANGGKTSGNRSGFAFTAPGDDDSGMYTVGDGEVGLYSNSRERLVVSHSDITVRQYTRTGTEGEVLFNIDNAGVITYAKKKPNAVSKTIKGGTRTSPVWVPVPYGYTEDWSIVVSLESFNIDEGDPNWGSLNWMHVNADPGPGGDGWQIVGEVCLSGGGECGGNGTAVNVNYLIVRK